MRRFSFFLALTIILSTFAFAMADNERGPRVPRWQRFRAFLSGYNEVHFDGVSTPATLRGAVSTKASGHLLAKIDKKNQVIEYELSYKGLESAVTQAHLHFGQKHTVGGIVIWLCQTTTTPAPEAVKDTPTCPAEGTVTGKIGPEQVLAAAGQGINEKEFDELVRAIRSEATYVNVPG